jgi:hypothetical protein
MILQAYLIILIFYLAKKEPAIWQTLLLFKKGYLDFVITSRIRAAVSLSLKLLNRLR